MSAETYKRKIFKIAVAACAATVLSAGYALDSTRHFLFRAREPVNQWALGDRTAHTNVGRGDLDHLHPRERRSPGEYPLFASMSGLPAAQLITMRSSRGRGIDITSRGSPLEPPQWR
jgi:hypothetical protein